MRISKGCSDDDLWAAVQVEERFLVTQDLDFSDIRRLELGSHHGVLLVRLPDHEQPRLAEYLAAWFQAAEDREGCFVVATPSKVRVRRPERSAVVVARMATTPATTGLGVVSLDGE